MTPTPSVPLSSRRAGMPRWVWRGLLVVAVLQCGAVLAATVARATGLIGDPATLPDAIVAATALCVVVLAVLLYRHYSGLTTESAGMDDASALVASAHIAADCAPLSPMSWQPVPYLAHDTPATSDLLGSTQAPPSLPLDALQSA